MTKPELYPDRARMRLNRQLDRLAVAAPRFAGWLRWLRCSRARLVRIPLAVLLVLGGLLGFLPVLGFWMLPLGLLLLAIDIPMLQHPVGGTVVRGRHWWRRRSR